MQVRPALFDCVIYQTDQSAEPAYFHDAETPRATADSASGSVGKKLRVFGFTSSSSVGMFQDFVLNGRFVQFGQLESEPALVPRL